MAKNETVERAALSATLRTHLDVIEACEQSGEPLSRYAERNGLSIHTLYQAKKELRKKGVLPPPQRPRDTAGWKRGDKVQRVPRFVQAVQSGEGKAAALAWRLRMPTGVVFESATPIAPDEIVRLVQALGSPS